MNKFLSKIKSSVLVEREIICVSNNGIKSRKVGSVFLFWNVLLVLWTCFVTIKYFELREKVAIKEDKITELRLNKQKLLSNIVLLEKNLNNIKNFVVALNKYDRFNSIETFEVQKDNNINNDNFLLVLDRVKNNVNNINLALLERINGLENIKNSLNFENNIQQVSFEEKAADLENSDIDQDVLSSIVLKKTLDNNLNSLKQLEKFVNSMPFTEPLEFTYVSSRYGKRLDPFIKTPREHHGVDLVGTYMAKIYAPAPGKVIFTGEKGGYGKTIIIEHDYNIKTLYGHLHNINVKLGDSVKRGDVIGIQGNTGRSTGQHLHYEILRGRDRFNPLEFIEIGSKFY